MQPGRDDDQSSFGDTWVMGIIRLLIRIPFVLLHLLVGTPATVLSFYPPFRFVKAGGEPFHDHMLRWWARTVCRIFGVRVKVSGRLQSGPCLVVANHISWLDIQVLHSLSPMGFVGKSEIGRWPVAGYVASVGGTVFHRRGSHDSSHGVVAAMVERLASGGKVAIFPEGGILHGAGVKRFHGRLFAAAIEAEVPVQPVMIRYILDEKLFEDVTFRDSEGLWANLARLLRQASKTAEVVALDQLPSEGRARKELASEAERAIREAFNSPVGAASV